MSCEDLFSFGRGNIRKYALEKVPELNHVLPRINTPLNMISLIHQFPHIFIDTFDDIVVMLPVQTYESKSHIDWKKNQKPILKS